MNRRDVIKSAGGALTALGLPSAAFANRRATDLPIIGIIDPALPESRRYLDGQAATLSLSGNPWHDWQNLMALTASSPCQIIGLIRAHDAEFFRAAAREHRMQATVWRVVAHKPNRGQSIIAFRLSSRYQSIESSFPTFSAVEESI